MDGMRSYPITFSETISEHVSAIAQRQTSDLEALTWDAVELMDPRHLDRLRVIHFSPLVDGPLIPPTVACATDLGLRWEDRHRERVDPTSFG